MYKYFIEYIIFTIMYIIFVSIYSSNECYFSLNSELLKLIILNIRKIINSIIGYSVKFINFNRFVNFTN